MTRYLLAFFLMLFLLSPFGAGSGIAMAGEEGWKTEFDAICGQSDNFMNMTVGELEGVLKRCDGLKPQIEKLEETPRKIYLKRLQMCRRLLLYMIETRSSAERQ